MLALGADGLHQGLDNDRHILHIVESGVVLTVDHDHAVAARADPRLHHNRAAERGDRLDQPRGPSSTTVGTTGTSPGR